MLPITLLVISQLALLIMGRDFGRVGEVNMSTQTQLPCPQVFTANTKHFFAEPRWGYLSPNCTRMSHLKPFFFKFFIDGFQIDENSTDLRTSRFECQALNFEANSFHCWTCTALPFMACLIHARYSLLKSLCLFSTESLASNRNVRRWS